LKGKNDSWTCIFFDENQTACRIYANRPLECKALKCWNTSEVKKIYTKDRLTRADLISEIEGLWDLLEDHQRRCDYGTIHKLVKALDGADKKNARQQLVEIIQYDIEIRKLVATRAELDVEMMDFLFGRPLTITIKNYGIRVQQSGKKIILMPENRR
jgi:Fe-S-cluster containining protein